MPWWKDRRRAQAGTTLVELLVSLAILGLALVLIVGTLSTGLLDSFLTKRNTASEAVLQYELNRITASAFDPGASPYSECFASENPTAPMLLPHYQDPCPGSSYAMRADVSAAQGPCAPSQTWTVVVVSWPGQAPIGSSISVCKANR